MAMNVASGHEPIKTRRATAVKHGVDVQDAELPASLIIIIYLFYYRLRLLLTKTAAVSIFFPWYVMIYVIHREESISMKE